MRFKFKKRQERVRITRRWFAFIPYEFNGTIYWLEYITVKGYWFIGYLTGTWIWMTEEVIETPNTPQP